MNYDRIILELMDRVSSLEEAVAALKAGRAMDDTEDHEYFMDTTMNEYSGGRDTTKYIFEGKKYGKNRLVLAVIQHYVAKKNGISAAELISTFDRSIQGSLGVIRTFADAKESYGDYEKRFFFQPDEIVRTTTENCVVCTQWGKFNIGNFISRAEQLGMHIQTIGGAANNMIGFGGKMNTAFATSQLIGQDKFIKLYENELENLHADSEFMSFIMQLRKKLAGMEISNTKAANTEIMNAFYYAEINEKFPEVADIVYQVKQYGKQASAHISIYYAMYIFDFQSGE